MAVPRDRAGPFDPTVVKKRPRRLDGCDDKVVALDAQGRTTRERQNHLEELYGTEVSPTRISTITDAVWADVRLWQRRPLETVYPIREVDCVFVKARHEGAGKTTAVSVARGVTLTGEQELLGLGLSETEGAKFWLAVFTALNQRGGTDCFVACGDGLTGVARRVGDDRSANPGATRHWAYRPTLLAVGGVATTTCRGPGSAHA